LLVNSTGWEC
jgi:hypothetical protein